MTRKTGNKTGKQITMTSPRSGATVPTGAHPKNTGGKKGRSGRKPDAFRRLLKAGSLAAARKAKAYLETADIEDPRYAWAAEYAAKFTRSEVPKTTKHAGTLTLHAVRELPPEAYPPLPPGDEPG